MKSLQSFLAKNTSQEFWKILALFLVWKVGLIISSILAINYIPMGYKNAFLGGGKIGYGLLPQFFGWVNFDGEHYLAIANHGYQSLQQAFFPLYPKLIWLFLIPFHPDFFSKVFISTFIGLIISNTALILGLIFLYQLIKIDYPQKIAWWVVVLTLVFPTSFFFGAVYSESLFLLFSVLCFYFYKRGNYFWSGVLGALASATRIFGVLIFAALIVEIWQRRVAFRKIGWLLLIPFGLLAYMLYLWLTIKDPLAFFHLQALVGEQRQSGLTLLPQVFYRYFKMIVTTNYQNPIFQTVILEFLTGIMFLGLIIYGFLKKVQLAYLIYLLLGYFITTFQGSLSSTPRYILVLFPGFLIYSIIFNKLMNWQKVLILILSGLWLSTETILFIRVYWIA